MSQKRIHLLQNTLVFSGVEEKFIAQVLQMARVYTCKKGHFFYHEGNNARSMFILEKGGVAILKKWQQQQYPIEQMVPGDCFGEMSLMDLLPRTFSAIASSTCKVIEISSSVMYQMYQMNLEQYTLAQMNIGRSVCGKLRDADKLLFQQQFGTKVPPLVFSLNDVR